MFLLKSVSWQKLGIYINTFSWLSGCLSHVTRGPSTHWLKFSPKHWATVGNWWWAEGLAGRMVGGRVHPALAIHFHLRSHTPRSVRNFSWPVATLPKERASLGFTIPNGNKKGKMRRQSLLELGRYRCKYVAGHSGLAGGISIFETLNYLVTVPCIRN